MLTAWLDSALERVGVDPAAIASVFPAAGRNCGHVPQPRPRGWPDADAARAMLLVRLPLSGAVLAAEVAALYRYGDRAERRAVLRTLPWLDVADGCVDLVRDALRTHDCGLVAAALGPYARHLDDAAWRQGVLTCVFMAIPLSVVDGLEDRAGGELATMLADLRAERLAAGRSMPADAAALLARLTQDRGI
jgi:hypothetical protein